MTRNVERGAILVLSLFCLIWGFVGLRLKLSSYVSEGESFFEDSIIEKNARFFNFSPAEEHMLETDRRFWKQEFSSRNPPTPAALPRIYRTLGKDDSLAVLSKAEVLELRQWSVLANTEHEESLKDLILGPLKGSESFKHILFSEDSRPEESCSLRKQDRAYRMAQIDMHKTEALQYLAQCNPRSAAVLWFAIQEASEKRDLSKLVSIGAEIQNLIASAGEGFLRWYALELYQLVHVLTNQLSAASK